MLVSQRELSRLNTSKVWLAYTFGEQGNNKKSISWEKKKVKYLVINLNGTKKLLKTSAKTYSPDNKVIDIDNF